MLDDSPNVLSRSYLRAPAPQPALSRSPSSLEAAARTLVATSPSGSGLIARFALGGVMLPHGAQKVFGWFGGDGFAGTMAFFTDTMGIPWVFALAAVLAESLGALALLLGAGTRIAAFAIGTNMFIATVTTHVQNGFFMNWSGTQQGEGFEFHVLAFALALIVVLVGGGIASIDASIERWLARRRSSDPT